MSISTRDPSTRHDAPATKSASPWRLELTVAVIGLFVGLVAVLLFLG